MSYGISINTTPKPTANGSDHFGRRIFATAIELLYIKHTSEKMRESK